MAEGWVCLHRKIMDNPIWGSEKFSKGQAWVDLILLANHKDGYIIVHGHKIIIKRGQIGWSEIRLSERWKWSRSKVRTFINLLEKEQQVIQQKNFKSSIITILNYDLYQNEEQQKNSKRTAKGQQKDTNNNENNENNGNNISPEKSGDDILNPDNPHSVEGFPNDIIRFVTGFQEAAKKELGSMGVKVDAKLIKNGCETIDRLIRLDNFSQADIFSAIRWGYKDEFWSKQIRSLASIRNKQPNGCTKFQNLFAAHKLSFKPAGFTQDANTRLKSNIEAGRRFLENGEPRQEEVFGDYDGTCRRLLIDDNGCGS